MLRHTLHVLVIATFLAGLQNFSAYGEDDASPKNDTVAQKPAQQATTTPAAVSSTGTPESSHSAAAIRPTDKKVTTQDTKATPGKDAKPAGNAATATQPAAPAETPASPGTSESSGANNQKVSTEALEPNKIVWPFGGMTGNLDKQAAQRGFQIYSQICSACHSMNLVAYRSLGELGFSIAEIKAVASQKQVDDMDDSGQHIQRPAQPFDHFVAPFANEKASRAANNGAYPPDLSLIIKAREQGPDYVYSILTGFGNPPANEPAVAGKYYNPYFQGHWISMPPPLHDNAVTYQDGTPADLDHMARDVVTFLQWAAEPEMQTRHETGIKVIIFLLIMVVLFYISKKRVWKNLGK